MLRDAQRHRQAFGVFYERHGATLLSFLVRRTGSAEAGADLTAEVFAAALAGVDRFDPDAVEPGAWLYGIARHKLADFHRAGYVARRAQRRLGMPQISLDDEALERVERLASLEVSAVAIWEAMDDLPDHERDAVLARVVDECDYATLSADGGVSQAAVRQRVARGLAGLRRRLEDHG